LLACGATAPSFETSSLAQLDSQRMAAFPAKLTTDKTIKFGIDPQLKPAAQMHEPLPRISRKHWTF
jgi:hypothetical protein